MQAEKIKIYFHFNKKDPICHNLSCLPIILNCVCLELHIIRFDYKDQRERAV